MTAPVRRAQARARLRGGPLSGGVVMRRRHRPTELGSDADLVDSLVRSLRSGCSLDQALREAVAQEPTPSSADLGQVIAAVDQGRPLIAALRDGRSAADRSTARLLRLLTVGLATGGPLTDVLDDAAGAIRQREAAQADALAHAAQARASAAVVAVLPVGFLALSMVAAPAVPGVLLGTTIGRMCLVLGGTLDAVGWWWMNRLIAGVGR